MAMTDFSALKEELNGVNAADDQHSNKLKSEIAITPELKKQLTATEQTGSLDSPDLPHMDTPSPVHSPPSTLPSSFPSNHISATNGILNIPPLPPTTFNLNSGVSLSPTITAIPTQTPATFTPLPTNSTSNTSPSTFTPLPTLSNNPLPAPTTQLTDFSKALSPSSTFTPLPSLSSTPAPAVPNPAKSTPLPSPPSTSVPTTPTTFTPLPSPSSSSTPAISTTTNTKAPAASNTSTQQQLEKAQKDLARLRQHLMEMEEQHTLETEAMAEKITQLENATQQNAKKGSSQDSTIQNLTAANERLTSTLKEKELDLETTSAALYNLQNVLTQFQVQREEDIKNETQTLRNEAARANQQAATYKKERDALQEKVKRITELEEHTRTLQHELTEKTRTILMMQEEVEPLRRALNNSAERLSQMSQYEQNLVEKSVVSKLIVTYLSGGKKQDVLSLMARILNFTEEEMQKVGLIPAKGWIPFLRSSTSLSSSSSSISSPRGGVGGQERTVGDLWMEFLLKEVGEAPKEGQGQGSAQGQGGFSEGRSFVS